jgi:hypothetical protein
MFCNKILHRIKVGSLLSSKGCSWVVLVLSIKEYLEKDYIAIKYLTSSGVIKQSSLSEFDLRKILVIKP